MYKNNIIYVGVITKTRLCKVCRPWKEKWPSQQLCSSESESGFQVCLNEIFVKMRENFIFELEKDRKL